MNVLFIGDIIGRTGRYAVKNLLADIIEKNKIDITIANGENSAGGFGITKRVADELISYGIDILTMGNHTWDNKKIFDFIDDYSKIVRPLNYNENLPGQGWTAIKYKDLKIAIINFIGQIFLIGNNSPFTSFDKYIKDIKKEADIILIDFHAEATGEKLAFANYVDGKVAGVVGTHTHVQTSDNMLLKEGTAYITDLGMTGAADSILGMSKERVIKRFQTQIPIRYKVGKGSYKLEGAIIDINEKSGLSNSIKRLRIVKK